MSILTRINSHIKLKIKNFTTHLPSFMRTLWFRVVSAVVIVGIILPSFSILIIKQLESRRYTLSASQRELVGKSTVDVALIKDDTETISYNRADEASPQDVQKVLELAANKEDATGKEPYQASLAKDPKQGITFSDSEGDRTITLTPLFTTSAPRKDDEGRVVYPSNGSEKHVYSFKKNGIKSDIILTQAPDENTKNYQWELGLGSNLEAKQLPNGGIGIYSADPLLFGNLQVGDDKSQQLVDNARKNGEKNVLVFELPAPFITNEQGIENYDDVNYKLDTKAEKTYLTLETRNLQNQQYPLSIDPTITVTTTSDFQSGYDDGMIDYTTSNQIARNNLSSGDVGAATTNTNRLPSITVDSVTAVYNGYMYVLNSSNTDIVYAIINGDGTIGTFTTNANSFTTTRGNPGLHIYNGYMYVTGGLVISTGTATCKNSISLDNGCNDVQYAPVNSDGTVGVFTTSTNYFRQPRYNQGSTVYNGYLYILGGTTNRVTSSCLNSGSGQTCNDIQYAPINPDGSIGAFTTNTNYMPVKRSILEVDAYNGYMYISGGDKPTVDGDCVDSGTSQYCNDISYTKINADGSVGIFAENTNYFTGVRYDHGMTVHNGYLYIGGGNIGGNSCFTGCDETQYAPIYPDGTIGVFTTSTNLLNQGRYRNDLAAYNGYLYYIGGAHSENVPTYNEDCQASGFPAFGCDDIEYLPIDAGPPPSASTSTFSTNTNYFTTPREGHATVAYNGYLYVLGGDISSSSTDCKNSGTSTHCNDIQYATINDDGSIGTFTTNANYFNSPRTLHSAVAYNGYLYVIGGVLSSSSSSCKDSGTSTDCNDIQYAAINSNGSIGTFTTNSNYFSYPRGGHTVTAYNGYMYIVGGDRSISDTNCKNSGTSTDCNDIQYAAINSNGSIGTFTTNSNYFATPRTGHTSVAYNGYLYVIGGYQANSDTNCKDSGTNNYCNDIQYAAINSNGTIGTFTTNTNYFSFPRFGHSTSASNGILYIQGGEQVTSDTNCKNSGTNQNCNDTRYAVINSDGSVGTFTLNTEYFNFPRYYQDTVVANGYVYIIGGYQANSDTNCKNSGTSNYCNDILYAKLNMPHQTANYQKLVDTGATNSNNQIDSVVTNGQAVCGYELSYKTASHNGSFGSSTRVPFVVPGATVTINADNSRYILLLYTFDDQLCGTRSNVTDIVVSYSYSEPPSPTLISPNSGTSGLSVAPQFQMRTSQEQDSYLRYKIELCSTSDCSSIIRTIDQTASQTGWTGQDQQTSTAYTGDSSLSGSTIATHNYQSPVLNFDSQYWWRAYAIDPAISNIWSSASQIYTFYTNDTPAAPELNLPVNNASLPTVLPEFRLASTDENSDSLQYKIEVCSTSNCSSIVRTIDQTLSQTGWVSQSQLSGTAYSSGPSITQYGVHQYQPSALTANTQYWWRAYAIDPSGTNQWSSTSTIWTFTTGSATPTSVNIGGGTTIYGGVNLSTGN